MRSPGDAEAFFITGTYRDSRYGRDFVDWYNASLVDRFDVWGYLGLTVLRMSDVSEGPPAER